MVRHRLRTTTGEPPTPLPIDGHLAAIARAIAEHRRAVIVAPPGAGKTTRVPPALLARGPLILLQPRRIAARAIARRIAAEQGMRLGEEVGWQVRFERRFTRRTRLLVATEGVLTARLLEDPLLSGFATIVLDEFHERSLHADLALALGWQAARARGDLALVVMSATLDAATVAAFLDGAPVLEVPARAHPVAVRHAPGLDPAAAAAAALAEARGHILVFLPGMAEIRRAGERLRALLGQRDDAAILPLHGSLAAAEQDAALAPAGTQRKVILATNVAETSLTVDGVSDVIDSGLERVLRFDPARGIDRLDTERISLDSAEQRAGRAGRTGPGRALRLWHEHDRLRPHRDPEIRRADLAAPLLDVLGWGGEPSAFAWFEPPPAERVAAALELLERLGATAAGRLTPLGQTLRRLPLHPRLGRVLVAAGGSTRAAAAAAVLSERDFLRGEMPTCDSDLLLRVDRLAEAPPGLRQAARALEETARRLLGDGPDADRNSRGGGGDGGDEDEALRRALLLGYPDRVARRREPGSTRLLLASGHGAVLGRSSGVRDGEWLVALEVVSSDGAGEAQVRLASRIERDWLAVTTRQVVHRFEPARGRVLAVEEERYGAIVLAERPASPDPSMAEPLLVAALRERGLAADQQAVLRRLRFAGIDLDVDEALGRACRGATSLPDVDLIASLAPAARTALERQAPRALRLPSGRLAAIAYREDGTVVLSARLQELFGLADTPRIGPRQAPVTLELLAPNGRAVQTTQDLRSFWEGTYAAVRRELRGRYPKHPWPEDPWTAAPTSAARRRKRSP